MERSQWETLYRWEWFRREQWRPGFRAQKAGKTGGSCRIFKDLLAEIGGDLALDCTCGFGLKTIVMKEMHVDGHHLFLIEGDGPPRLETATIREPVYWHWDVIHDLFRAAGFSALDTRTSPHMGHRNATIQVNVARK